MKIIFVISQAFDPFSGGVQMTTFKLSKKFTEMGLESVVYSFDNSGHILPKYTRLHFAPNTNKHHNKENINHFYKYIKEEQPDFIISQVPYEVEINNIIKKLKDDLNIHILACLRNSLFSVKLNIDLYIKNSVPSKFTFLFHNFLGRFLFQKIHKRKHATSLKNILDIYDRFVMFGPPNEDEIKYFINDYKQGKLAYIPNSIPEVQENVPQKENRLLWLSRLSYSQKQAQFILPLWKKIYDKLPDWHFDVVGDGDAFNDIEKQIKDEKIPRINLYGKQKPDSYYSRAPIYLMTSANEGFPNTIIEAQSYGCIPIVFNSYPIAAWVIDDTKNGFLIKVNDIDSMAKSITDLIDKPKEIKTMTNRALHNAKRFHIDKVGQIWMELFTQLKN